MDLSLLRKKIDGLDAKIIELLNDRAAITLSIGQEKIKNKKPIYAPDREQDVLKRIKALNRGPITDEAVDAIYREIMSASLALEKPLSVAVLGKKGSYTYLAAEQIFGQQITYDPCRYILEAFQKVENGECDYGVLPIENSTEGVVTQTMDLLVDSDLKICRQKMMEIKHNLLSNTTKDKIKTIYSNPQVFNQCRHWLVQNMPNVGLVEMPSNTEAAERASHEKNSAALASTVAAQEYGLKILISNISDLVHNTTRFCVIGTSIPSPTGHDRTSVAFSIKDKVGALHGMLTPFMKHKINLTKIESRPSKKKAWDYYFFVDCEGHQSDPRVARALAQLEGMCKFLKILGSYPDV